MKIAYVYDVLYPETIGGVEKRIHEIGIRLARKGHEIHLFGMKYWDGPSVIHRDGMIIHGVCPAMGLYVEGRRSIPQALRYTCSLIPHLLKADMDMIDCQNFPYFPAIAVSLIARLKKQSFVVTWHEFWGKYWFAYLGLKGVLGLITEWFALRCSPKAIAVSPLTKAQMKAAGYPGETVIIPNGLNLSQIDAISPSGKSSDIIFVGRFIPEKHPEYVVEAVRMVLPDYPLLRCLMVGDGPEYQSVFNKIQNSGLSGTIECTGFVADYQIVLSLMKSSKIFILPSEREGFGIAAIEAMACGLSLVTVRHPRNAASVHVRSGAGYLAEMDVSDIARGIRICLGREPDKKVLSTYVSAHDWDTITETLEQYYLSMR